MKTNKLIKNVAGLSLSGLATLSVNATTLVTNDLFYLQPEVRKPGETGIVVAVADQTPHTHTTAGESDWSHTVTGYTQSRVGFLGLAVAEAELAPYTTVNGTSLTFGRELTAEVLGGGIASNLDDVLGDIAGISLDQSWNSTATVNAPFLAGQTYQVTLDVTAGGGIPADLLTATTIGINGAGLQMIERNTFNKVSLLDLVSLGEDETGTVNFLFEATQELTSLDLLFDAATFLDVNTLGGAVENQELLTFSNLSITSVPEPSTTLFATLAACFLIGTRRRSIRNR